MIRSIVFPRVLGKSLDELQPALELFRALGFEPGNEWHEGGSHGLERLAPKGGIEFIAASDAPAVDVMVEVSDAEEAYEIVKRFIPTLSVKATEEDGKSSPTLSPKAGDEDGAPVVSDGSQENKSTKPAIKIRREIGGTPYGARLFELEVAGLRIGFLTYAKKPGESHGLEGSLDARGKRFGIVVSRFNSFITERLLDGTLQALRQCGANTDDITVAHVPGAFEIPSAARQLAETGKYAAIVCIGCLLRGGTLHYEVIANEVTRGVGQSAQETGVPHAFGVLTCDTLEQAIDRAGLKAGNKGFEAGLAAVEMASLRQKISKRTRPGKKKETAGPSAPLRSAQDDRTGHPDSSAAGDESRSAETADPSTPLRSARDDNSGEASRSAWDDNSESALRSAQHDKARGEAAASNDDANELHRATTGGKQ
jgi:6,7-dimethyl-8-ribityllumazine synthase